MTLRWDTPTYHKAKDIQVADADGGRYSARRSKINRNEFTASFTLGRAMAQFLKHQCQSLEEAQRVCEEHHAKIEVPS